MTDKKDVSQSPVDHIVVVMFENRSFDNLMGWLYQTLKPTQFIPAGSVPRYNGLHPSMLENFANPVTINGETYNFPPTRGFRFDGDYLRPPPYDPHEEFEHVTEQVYGPCNQENCGWPFGNVPAGKQPTMKGFANDYQNSVLGKVGSSGVTPEAVARIMETGDFDDAYPMPTLGYAYAVCDAWYSSVPTQTDPNRAFMACGSSNGKVNNSANAKEDFPMDTVWNRLSEFGKSWKVYWENTFFPVVGSQSWTQQSFAKLRDLGDEYFPHMAAFHRDARLGRLPFFSFLEPSWTLEEYKFDNVHGVQGNDIHPPGDVRTGLQFLSAVVASLMSNQQAWAKTLLLITFDEHGGTWDHVPPPIGVVPPSIAEYNKQKANPTGFLFDRLGPRVPTILMSPMVKAGTVFRSSKPSDGQFSYHYDHCSIPATVLKLAGVPRDQWKLGDRVAAAPTFDEVLTEQEAPRLELDFGGLEESPENIPEKVINPVHFNESFIVQCMDEGPFKGWYVGGAQSDSAESALTGLAGSNLQMTQDAGSALKFRMGMGYDGNDTSRPDTMFVRAPGVVYLQYAIPGGVDSENKLYVRAEDFWTTTASVATFGEDDQWWYGQWYIRESGKRFPAQGFDWSATVQFAYQALNSTQHWLPRKLIANYTQDNNGKLGNWVKLGADADWANDSVGNWRLIKA